MNRIQGIDVMELKCESMHDFIVRVREKVIQSGGEITDVQFTSYNHSFYAFLTFRGQGS